jgi:nitronate monooxygenase
MALQTRLTERLGIEHPILSAPMGSIAGGRLAAAVTQAGGLGLIGGGYGDAAWLEREFGAAGNARVGCGFITWSLARSPELLDGVLGRAPAALMLSFGAPSPHAERVKSAGVPLICQVQTLAHVREALAAGADIIVAQGSEAGGHGATRATLTLVPEVADHLRKAAPNTLLVAAGGIADGRGLAAALMLGADGVLAGSRMMASEEALTPPGFRTAILAADGDATVRTHAVDTVRGITWPAGFTGRALTTGFVKTWHGRDAELAEPSVNARESERFWTAFRAGDAEHTGVFFGEVAGLIHEVKPAADIVQDMVRDAERLLRHGAAAIAVN